MSLDHDNTDRESVLSDDLVAECDNLQFQLDKEMRRVKHLQELDEAHHVFMRHFEHLTRAIEQVIDPHKPAYPHKCTPEIQPHFGYARLARLVEEITGVSMALIRSGNREKYVVSARFALIYLLYHHCGGSLTRIGNYCNRDHTCIHYALKTLKGHRYEKAHTIIRACEQHLQSGAPIRLSSLAPAPPAPEPEPAPAVVAPIHITAIDPPSMPPAPASTLEPPLQKIFDNLASAAFALEQAEWSPGERRAREHFMAQLHHFTKFYKKQDLSA
jgi:hypothetical protein